MADRSGAVSSLEEFFEGLDTRGVEPDLRETLRTRVEGPTGRIERAGEESLIVAVAERLVPGAVPPGVLAAFLDRNFDRQLGRGDEREGLLPRSELIPAGFRLLDDEARRRHDASFADLGGADQDGLLHDAEGGRLEGGPSGFDGGEWFQRVRDLLLLGYGSDPRGMVEMGFPGPSYETGHVWLGEHEVARRAEHAPGYEQL